MAILNSEQAARTEQWIDRFQEQARRLQWEKAQPVSHLNLHPLVIQAGIDAAKSVVEELEEELRVWKSRELDRKIEEERGF